MADLSIANALLSTSKSPRADERLARNTMAGQQFAANPVIQSAISDFATGEYAADAETHRLYERLAKLDPSYREGLSQLNKFRQTEAAFRTQQKYDSRKTAKRVGKMQAYLDKIQDSKRRYMAIKGQRDETAKKMAAPENSHAAKVKIKRMEIADNSEKVVAKRQELEAIEERMANNEPGDVQSSLRMDAVKLRNEIKDLDRGVKAATRQADRMDRLTKFKAAKKSDTKELEAFDKMLASGEFKDASEDEIRKAIEDLASAKSQHEKEVDGESKMITRDKLNTLRSDFSNMNPGKRALRELLAGSMSLTSRKAKGGTTGFKYEEDASGKLKGLDLTSTSGQKALEDVTVKNANDFVKGVFFETFNTPENRNAGRGYVNQIAMRSLGALRENISELHVNDNFKAVDTAVNTRIAKITDELKGMKKKKGESAHKFNARKAEKMFDEFAEIWEYGDLEKGESAITRQLATEALKRSGVKPTKGLVQQTSILLLNSLNNDGIPERASKSSKAMRKTIQQSWQDLVAAHKITGLTKGVPFFSSIDRVDTLDAFLDFRAKAVKKMRGGPVKKITPNTFIAGAHLPESIMRFPEPVNDDGGDPQGTPVPTPSLEPTPGKYSFTQ